jgi:predicted phosphodiesterase
MKILVLSDLHLEFEGMRVGKTEADVVVLSGDIDIGLAGMKWAAESFPDIPVVYVNGNHEYYRQSMDVLMEDQREMARYHKNIHFLENSVFTYTNVRFLGCTLWTDLLLQGQARYSEVCAVVEQQIADFTMIHPDARSGRGFTTDIMVEMHKESVSFLKNQLNKEFDGKTVIVTHHAPSRSVLPLNHRKELLSSAFASGMEGLMIRYRPDVWIFGHTHHNIDYHFNSTRIISNQRGYCPMEMVPGFREDLIIEI